MNTQFDKKASCSINVTNFVKTFTFKIKTVKKEEKYYCENIFKDINVKNKFL